MDKYLITVLGPTAIGKTHLAISIARHFKCEILSADSRQFYKEMRIGTAVPTKEELSKVPHHFIQHKSILESYTVGDFEQDALHLLRELFKRMDVAVMVGGSGLYLDAVIHGLDHFPTVKPGVREGLNKVFQQEGIEALRQQLSELDPVHYQKVDLDNPHRLIRALEVCISSGKPYSSFFNQQKKPRFFKHLLIGLTADRELLYSRINGRVDKMMQDGLKEEAENLVDYKDLNALQTVGYQELFAHFEGKWDLQTAVEEIKKNTRRFAKRQLTWFRKKEGVLWFEYPFEERKVIDSINSKMGQLK